MIPGRIFVIGDSHIGLTPGSEKGIVEWLDRLMPHRPRALYLNGDLFHYLIAHPKFLRAFPNVHSLARATDDDVTAAWSGLGYYRRAKMLHDAAGEVVRKHGGIVPRDVETLRTIPGIGRYTAGAIASIAYGQRAPIVDGNVSRILARLSGIDDRAWDEAETLVAACSSPRRFNQGLMEIGALVCHPSKPDCAGCPLRAECHAFRTDQQESLPRPRPKGQTTAMRIALYIVRNRRGFLLMRRESGALMDGMFHLPQSAGLFKGHPLPISSRRRVGVVRHTITNRRIEFVVYSAQLGGRRPVNFSWIDESRLADLPHPSYVRKALRAESRA